MATFFTLPKAVRNEIYRLALVSDGYLTMARHEAACGNLEDPENAANNSRRELRRMPSLLKADKRVDKEAAAIYFGENHFMMEDSQDMSDFVASTYPRHLRMIKKLTFVLDHSTQRYPSSTVRQLQRLHALEELYVELDEEGMVRQKLLMDTTIVWHSKFTITPQANLRILQCGGIGSLRELSGIRHVEFTKFKSGDRPGQGGPIKDGYLETIMAPHIMRSSDEQNFEPDTTIPFRFLALPAELRNRIYTYLLAIYGGVAPSKRIPSSCLVQGPAANSQKIRNGVQAPASALSILAVNRQIHDEAAGLFYACNELTFNFPEHLLAFTQQVSVLRLDFVRSITLVYRTYNSGGIQSIDLALDPLRHLKSLRKFHLIMRWEVMRYVHHSKPDWKPSDTPGIDTFLRLARRERSSLEEVVLRDLNLEDSRAGIAEYMPYDGSHASIVAMRGRTLDSLNANLALTCIDNIIKRTLAAAKTMFDDLLRARRSG
ncbi:hypothetical protein LTR66_011366 [Elasticomyces elasticus]|nr:hypothetical protein LTR66_011366 [Elasticomyces elasticus]